MGRNDHNEKAYIEEDAKMAKRNHEFSLIRHPSSDKELEKFPIDKIQNLAMQCYSVIEQPTNNLSQIFKTTFDQHRHDRTWWIQCYKLARFEKMMEFKRNGDI